MLDKGDYQMGIFRKNKPNIEILKQNKNIPELINAMKHKDYNIRKEAVVALGEIGPDAKDAVPSLKHALKDKSKIVTGEFIIDDDSRILNMEDFREYAIVALGEIGPEAISVAPEIIDIIDSSDSITIESALQKIGPEIQPYLEKALLKAMKKSNFNKVIPLIKVWSNMGFEVGAIVKILIIWLKNKETFTCAIEGLVTLGFKAGDAIPELIKLYKENSIWEDCEIDLSDSINKLIPPSTNVLPELIDLLNDSDSLVRYKTIEVIGEMKQDGLAAVDELTKLIDTDDKYMKDLASDALKKITGRNFSK